MHVLNFCESLLSSNSSLRGPFLEYLKPVTVPQWVQILLKGVFLALLYPCFFQNIYKISKYPELNFLLYYRNWIFSYRVKINDQCFFRKDMTCCDPCCYIMLLPITPQGIVLGNFSYGNFVVLKHWAFKPTTKSLSKSLEKRRPFVSTNCTTLHNELMGKDSKISDFNFNAL